MTEIEIPPLFDLSPAAAATSGRDQPEVAQRVVAERSGQMTAVLRGDTDAIVSAVIASDCACWWSSRDRSYRVPLKRLEKVVGALRAAGVTVDYRQRLW